MVEGGGSMSGGQPRRKGSGLRAMCLWALFLLLTFGAMLACLARLATTAPIEVAAHAIHAQAMVVGDTAGTTIGTAPKVTAPSAFLFDADTGVVYYAKDADDERPMASCTKIMTLLLAVEHGNLDQMVKVGADAAALVRPDSSYMGVSTGEQLTLRDLLYGLVLPSGNDAAIAIADAISGSVPNFVALMNERAKELGLTRTHFVTPNGLDLTPDGHYTTARDLSVLAGVAMKNPQIVTITSTLEYRIPKTATHKAYDLVTGIDLLPGARSPYVGAIGVKPGYTGLAGFCEAFAAIRHGHLIVGTVLAEPSWQIRIVDMRALLDFGFAQHGISPAPVVPSWTYPPPDK
jgi:D-alanyl-D-alanine carboxypeptidase (penicillin-binding protein 5/6)